MAKLAETIKTYQHDAPSGVVFFGAPDDLGVRLNGGRPGAARGPAAFRDALARYGSAEATAWPTLYDAGDIEPAGELEETHGRVAERAASVLRAGHFCVMIGGGHDLTLPFVRAVIEERGPLAGVYFDAHLDVREETGSGMPFRRLIEDCGVSSLVVHGLDPRVNAREHADYFESQGGRIASSDLAEPWPEGPKFVSFDLDVIDQAHAPGVSAQNPAGWTGREAVVWAERAGRDPSVACFDIMELSPPYDEGGRTARFAAAVFVSFCRGFAARCEP
ncbi:MAG: formimidoylglutamase [Planctomycetota bacterium]